MGLQMALNEGIKNARACGSRAVVCVVILLGGSGDFVLSGVIPIVQQPALLGIGVSGEIPQGNVSTVPDESLCASCGARIRQQFSPAHAADVPGVLRACGPQANTGADVGFNGCADDFAGDYLTT